MKKARREKDGAPWAAGRPFLPGRMLVKLGACRADKLPAESPPILEPSHLSFWVGESWLLAQGNLELDVACLALAHVPVTKCVDFLLRQNVSNACAQQARHFLAGHGSPKPASQNPRSRAAFRVLGTGKRSQRGFTEPDLSQSVKSSRREVASGDGGEPRRIEGATSLGAQVRRRSFQAQVTRRAPNGGATLNS
jgi:hypothetical protein